MRVNQSAKLDHKKLLGFTPVDTEALNYIARDAICVQVWAVQIPSSYYRKTFDDTNMVKLVKCTH